ncbi:MAG: Hsp70 family protein, partial [Vicinamibacterales bacterium]|nr:Hsp70 family protein [Vicinamibacterales bacterium]
DCRSLARFELRGIPPMAAGAARIRVSFQVDADGLLSVTARESASGVAASVSVKPSYGLSDDDITRMLRDSFDHARDDVHVRALQEARVEGERMLAATESALAADGDLLEAAERAAIDADLAALRAAVAGADHRQVKSAIDRVNRVTEPFAARRMDRTVRRALAGRSVETFSS